MTVCFRIQIRKSNKYCSARTCILPSNCQWDEWECF